MASCAAGLEELLTAEVKNFGGANILRSRGLIRWRGDLESAYRACLWSRFASRVFFEIAGFQVQNEAELYQRCGEIDWSEHLDEETSFAVDISLYKSALGHSGFAALRVKDALVDQFRKLRNKRPSVQLERPGIRLKLYVHKIDATLAIDLSGESLHRRGYRNTGGIAPLKESLAAAIVSLTGWRHDLPQNAMFLDPLCGSGTLLIEAALIYGDSAPGLGRGYFGFNGWRQHDNLLWSRLVDEAIRREEAGLNKAWPPFLGYDNDPLMVAAARKNIIQAGLDEKIVVKQAQLAFLKRPVPHGFLVCNPPYGERLAEQEDALQIYRALGRILRNRFDGWTVGIFTSNPDFSDQIGLPFEQRVKLFNGPIACRLLIAQVQADSELPGFVWQPMTKKMTGDGSEFANRLSKNLRKLFKWAKREKIACLRVYDRDLPEFNLSVDLYGKWVHVQEYAPPSQVDKNLAAKRFKLALALIREVLMVPRERVFIKTRRRQKGKSQYQKQGRQQQMHVVREEDCYLLINFKDYLDTGLFLDHRPLRKRIGRLAAGKRFLNLYSYTGAATIHAAIGKAVSTTSVDLSAAYLRWCRLNLALNGFGGPAHEIIQADCLTWLAENRNQYDLVLVDPPTFSNTKKKNRSFDIQNDHTRLLQLVMPRVAPGGLLFFSTNFRRFQLAPDFSEKFKFKDISPATIPPDFKRNSRVHKCWQWEK